MTARRLPRSVRRSAAPIGARGVSNPGRRSSILICRILQSSDEIRVPPARRSRRPTDFPPALTQLFASILCILWCFVPRRCSEFEFWTHSGPDPRNIMQITLLGAQNSKSGHLKTQILDTLCKSCSLGPQNSNSGRLRAHPSSHFSSQQSINSIKFKRVDPQYDVFSTGRR